MTQQIFITTQPAASLTPHCDLCGAAIERTTLKGLCGHCAGKLESGKIAARIVVAESRSIAQRAERRAG